MDCPHESLNEGHTLPCRHVVCLPCVESIDGLLEGMVFSCPVCQNCSQYVNPHEEVYGKPTGTKNSPIGSLENSIADTPLGSVAGNSETNEIFATSEGSKAPSMRNQETRSWQPSPTFPPSVSAPRYRGTPPTQHYEELRPTPGIMRGAGYNTTVNYGDGSAFSVDFPVPAPDEKNEQASWIEGNVLTNCLDHNKPVYYFCKTCNAPVCATCKSDSHLSHNIFDMEKEEDQSEREKSSETPEEEKACEKHGKPIITICSEKQEFLCGVCERVHYCRNACTNHTPINLWETFLEARIDVFRSKLNSISEKEKDYAATLTEYKVYLEADASRIEREINDATERAKAQLEANRMTMIDYIKKKTQEKLGRISSSSRDVDMTGFVEEARRMAENTAQYIRERKYQSAFKSHWQMAETVEQISASGKKRTPCKKEELGLRVNVNDIPDRCTDTRSYYCWSEPPVIVCKK